MKKLLASILMALSLSTQADQIEYVHAATIGYLSSYTNVSVGINADKGQWLAFNTYSSVTGCFCGISALDDPGNILAADYGVTMLKVPEDNFYMVLCIKTGGISSDIVLAVTHPKFYTEVQTRSNVAPDDEDMLKLQNKFIEMFGE